MSACTQTPRSLRVIRDQAAEEGVQDPSSADKCHGTPRGLETPAEGRSGPFYDRANKPCWEDIIRTGGAH